MGFLMKRIFVLYLTIFALTGAAVGVAATNNTPVITGCVNKSSGVLRIATKCLKNETKIQWNQQGEIGPQGIQGLTGERGLTGDEGATGEKGEKGEQGVAGAAGIGFAGPQGAAGANGAQGAAGAQGPAGQQLVVRDSVGTLVGYLIGTLSVYTGFDIDPELMPASNFAENAVQVWDPVAQAKFVYDFSGRPLTGYVLFSEANCSGTAYLANSGGNAGDYIYAPSFIAFSDSPTGTIRWYEPSSTRYVAGTISIASGSRYANNCRAGSEFGNASFSGDVPHVVLNPISAPIPTIVGPLRLALS